MYEGKGILSRAAGQRQRGTGKRVVLMGYERRGGGVCDEKVMRRDVLGSCSLTRGTHAGNWEKG